jgi:hypothetical protein
MQSWAHCCTNVAMSAEESLAQRPKNQSMLQARVAGVGVNAANDEIFTEDALEQASSWREIWTKTSIVIVP